MLEVKFSAAVFLPIPFVRFCDVSACYILGPSESPEAAVGRSQVFFPTRAGVVLSCFLV